MWIRLTVLVSLLLHLVSSKDGSIHEPGYCVFRDQGKMKRSTKPLASNTLAPELEVSSSLYQKIQNLCGPSAADILKPRDGEENARVCCTEPQFDTLQTQVVQAASLIGTCPACWYNFVGFWCHFTCSHNQATFIELTKTVQFPEVNGTIFADELNVYVTEGMATGLYESCKDVKQAALNAPAIDLLGGGAKNGFEMLDFLGNQKWQSGIEFKFPLIEVPLPFDNMTRLDAEMRPCDDADYGCTCVDCQKQCRVEVPPVDRADKSCYVGNKGWDCLGFTVVVLYLFFLTMGGSTMFAYFLIKKYRNKPLEFSEDGITDIPPSALSSPANEGRSRTLAIGDEEKVGLLETYADQDNERKVLFKYAPWLVDEWLQKMFYKLGTFCAARPLTVLGLTGVVLLVVSIGLTNFRVETRPIKLWVDPESKALKEKEFFDQKFSPFYRVTQFIITRNADESSDKYVFDHSFLQEVWHLEANVSSITAEVSIDGGLVQVSLDDLCIKPTGEVCATQSFSAYYQGDYDNFESDNDLDTLKACIDNYGSLNCFSKASQPIPPNLVLGGSNGNWSEAEAVVINLILKNSYDDANYIKKAEAWEKEVIKFMSGFESDRMKVAYSTESSIEEELARETYSDVSTIVLSYLAMFLYASFALGRVRRVLIKKAPQALLVDSRFSLGIAGILIVIASVIMSVGLLSYAGKAATLIVAEVIPFLVLAVGVDNIFILVNTFDRISSHSRTMALKRSQERPPSPDSLANYDGVDHDEIDRDIAAHQSVEARIALTLGQVGPSLLLSSVSETIAFSMGIAVTMPAVSMFSLFAAVAIICNFALQITCFVSLMTLDAKRRESGRVDCVPCLPVIPEEYMDEFSPEPSSPSLDDGGSVLEDLFRNYYAPFILNKYVKGAVIVIFVTMFVFLGVQQAKKVEVGLDQKIVLPNDSYLIEYFDYLARFLEVGPPLYFVFTGMSQDKRKNVMDLVDIENQKNLCGKFQDCNEWSVARVLDMEYQRNSKKDDFSTIATSSAVWLDDFVLFMNNIGRPCCVKNKDPYSCYVSEPKDDNGYPIDPYTSDDNNATNHLASCSCFKWRTISTSDGPEYFPLFSNYLGENPWNRNDSGALPRDRNVFMSSLKNWMGTIPNSKCSTAGYAAYGDSIAISADKEGNEYVEAFYIRTFHQVLRGQSDFIEALKDAKRIAKEIMEKTYGVTESLNEELDMVYPYSVFYVFFEQYLTVTSLTWELVLYALLATFLVSLLLLGSPLTSMIIVVVVFMMITNLVGVMTVWGVPLNAISAVNLVISVGIGVEFCVHVARGVVAGNAIDNRPKQGLVHRSLAELGSSVFSGITLTKIIGVVVLAFAKSEVFEVFYFRMYFSIVVFGALHGLVLLPVLLDLFSIGQYRVKGVLYLGPELSVLSKAFRGRN